MRRCGSSRHPALASNARDETPAAFSLGRRRRRRRGREKIVVARPNGEEGHESWIARSAALGGHRRSDAQPKPGSRPDALSDDPKVSLFKGTFELEMHLMP
jgi:hypothetical protein